MLDVLRSKWFWAVALIAIFVGAGIGVIIGVTRHTEAGLLEGRPRWDRGDFPLQVCAVHYAENDEQAGEVVGIAVHSTNTRLGFIAYALTPTTTCQVQVVLGAPTESGWTDPGGTARLYRTPEGVRCSIQTSNVSGEVAGLVIQHELGHCLGLAHDDFESSIMYPVQSPTPSGAFPPWITDHDRALLRDLYGPMSR